MVDIELVREILLSDILGWILAFIVGMVVYKLIDNMQIKIERHALVKDIENTFNELFSLEKAKILKQGESPEAINIRTTLGSSWLKYVRGETEIKIMNGQRYVLIKHDASERDASDREYISTQALHETLILFRRIEKLFKDSIMKPVDLTDLWREILPYSCEGRIEFFQEYFNKYDVHSMVYVIINTVLACETYKNKDAIEYLKEKIDRNAFVRLIENNSRFGRLDKGRISKFKKVLGL